jgi:TolA-binding protein
MAAAFEQLATTYSGSAAGERAELQAAGALFEAGSYAEAQTQFKKCLDGNPSGPLAAIAQLGYAASLDAQNQTEPAAAAYGRVLSVFPSSPCVLQAEFALGRIAEQQNNPTEAMNHYEKVRREAAGTSLQQEAMIREASVKARMEAAAPKPAGPPQLEAAPKPAVQPPAPPAAKP